ncbi:MAG TPA: PIG-L deacetylase family protein [Acidimicrobiales bacterium]
MDDAPTELQELPEDWDRALVVMAHPDDMEYGGAAAVARWTDQGKEVAYLLVTRGEAGIDGMAPPEAAAVREAEQRASCELVGVDTVEFLDHPDGLVEYGLPLRRDLAAAVRRHRPELVVAVNHRETYGGTHLNMADHRHVGQATIDAVRDAANRWVFTDLADRGLEPWSGTRYLAVVASPQPTHAVDVTTTFDRGVASLRAHAAYLAGLGADDPEPMLRGFAEATAQRFGGRLAVAFEVFTLA